MKKNKEQIPKGKKPLSNKKLIIVSTALLVVIFLGFLLYRIFLQTPEVKFSFEAAIIDQIGENLPSNPESALQFNETVTSLLESADFNVSYHRSESITVDFYKGLAKYNYGMIILRAHAALRIGSKTAVDFFTSEPFDDKKHVSEQDNGLLTVGNYSWEPNKFYFAITPKFIESLEGYFPKSIVIAMGCWSLKSGSEEMAEAFIGKGAKAYIGWTGAVGMSHSDNSTVRFLQYLLVNNMTIMGATNDCNNIRDPTWFSSILSYYPSGIGDCKLSDFITNAFLNVFLFATQAHFSLKSEKFYYFKSCHSILYSV